MNKEHNYEGGLFNYIVLKEEKEVIFYLHNPYPDCLKIPDIIEKMFSSDYKSIVCLLYTSPSPRDRTRSRMPSSA